MRGLADLVMRGPKTAIALAVVFACVPILSLISAAIVSLVLLRRGTQKGLSILMWALLPALVWASQGQLSTVFILLTAALLAVVLRNTVSWAKTLLTLIPAGAVMALVMTTLAHSQVEEATAQVLSMVEMYVNQAVNSETATNAATAPSVESAPVQAQIQTVVDTVKPLIGYAVIGVMVWFEAFVALLALILARVWQARLYNPGGFREEFHAIRLPANLSLLLLVTILLSGFAIPSLLMFTPVASLPLVVAGLAVLHGMVSIRKMSSTWLTLMYVLLIFTAQLVYPVIALTACVDSVVDFRGRALKRLTSSSNDDDHQDRF